MESVLKNGLYEVSHDEMQEIEGGIVTEILLVTGLGALGVAVVTGTTAVVSAAIKDLQNCYENGYNSVMISVSGGDAR